MHKKKTRTAKKTIKKSSYVVNGNQLPAGYLEQYLKSPVIIFDFRINRLIYVNQAFAELTGFTTQDLNDIQYEWFSRIHPADYDIWKEKIAPCIDEAIKKHVKDKDQPFTSSMCFRFRNKDEKYIHFLTQSNVIEWVGQKRAVVLNVLTDISQYKHDCKMMLEIKIYNDLCKEWKTVHTEKFHATPSMLTKHETDIMKLMAEGDKAKDICEKLNMNYYTVRSHWRNILFKTKCKSTANLRELALKEGWI